MDNRPNRFKTAWLLAKASFRVIQARKSLLIFPLQSTIIILALLSLAIIPLASSEQLAFHATQGMLPIRVYVIFTLVLLTFFYLTNLLSLLCSVAVTACAMEHIQGKPYSLTLGFQAMQKQLKTMMLWTIIATTVGTIIRLLQVWLDKWPSFEIAVTMFAGLTWFFATFFVLPVFIVENIGPFAAIKRSAHLMKDTWGTSITSSAGISLFLFAIRVLSLIPLVIGVATKIKIAMIVGASLTTVLVLATSIVNSTTQMVLISALYLYATDEQRIINFCDPNLLQLAFRHKTTS